MNAAHVFARTSVDFSNFAFLHEQGHTDHRAGAQSGWFATGAGGIAFKTRVSFDDFQFHEIRWAHVQRLTVIKGDLAHVFFFEPLSGVANSRFVGLLLLKVVRVHEVPELAVVENVLHLYIKNVGAFEAVAGFESTFPYFAGFQVAELYSVESLALAGFYEFVFDNVARVAVEHNLQAGLEFTGRIVGHRYQSTVSGNYRMALNKLPMIAQERQGWQVPDWRRLQADLVTGVAELCEQLELRPEQVPGGLDDDSEFPLRVPRRYLQLIEPGNPADPLLLQILATGRERETVPGYHDDPLEESHHTPVPGLLHKYHGRALLVVTGACAVHCRYCFRRHFPYQEHLSGGRWRQALDWLAQRPDISEVILSGGDPLTLSNPRLRQLLEELARLPHLRRLRIHSRTPVVIPERLDDDLVELLAAPRWRATLVLHANHPREISPALEERCRELTRAGVTLLNQSVLLAGINDQTETLAALSDALFEAGVLPYYLHQLDPVAGAAHFAVPDHQARSIHAALRDRLPGFLVPRLAREEPGKAAKTVLAG